MNKILTKINDFLCNDDNHTIFFISGIISIIVGIVTTGVGLSTDDIIARNIGIGFLSLSLLSFFLLIYGIRKDKWRDIMIKRKNQERDLERDRRNQLEREEKQRLREHVDLILEQVDDKYRVKLVYGDKTVEYLTYIISSTWSNLDVIKPVTSFRFLSTTSSINGWMQLFPESAKPTLKYVIEHYQKYGNLNPAPPTIKILETFIISRPQIEDPPDLTGIDTISELTPLLIEAERNDDRKAVNKILDKVDAIQNNTAIILYR